MPIFSVAVSVVQMFSVISLVVVVSTFLVQTDDVGVVVVGFSVVKCLARVILSDE